jgi:hypothetical protein
MSIDDPRLAQLERDINASTVHTRDERDHMIDTLTAAARMNGSQEPMVAALKQIMIDNLRCKLAEPSRVGALAEQAADRVALRAVAAAREVAEEARNAAIAVAEEAKKAAEAMARRAEAAEKAHIECPVRLAMTGKDGKIIMPGSEIVVPEKTPFIGGMRINGRAAVAAVLVIGTLAVIRIFWGQDARIAAAVRATVQAEVTNAVDRALYTRY